MSNWIWRTKPTSNWTNTRLWWAYLLDSEWDYILTNNNERIIVIVQGWTLNITSWTARPTI